MVSGRKLRDLPKRCKHSKRTIQIRVTQRVRPATREKILESRKGEVTGDQTEAFVDTNGGSLLDIADLGKRTNALEDSVSTLGRCIEIPETFQTIFRKESRCQIGLRIEINGQNALS